MDYISINKKSWNDKVDPHVSSSFYDMNSFINGKNTLNEIELNVLGDVKNKTILHLQCHFGQDTLSLARMGAQVTGVDFSEKAIETANSLNQKLGLNAEFLCSDVLTLDQVHDTKYDIIFSSYGTIGWLPDINKWAKIISNFLKPGGKFVFAEFHPVVWMFDNDFSKVQYSYHKSEPIIEEEEGSYASKNDTLHTSITWNHGLSEVITALLHAGLTLHSFKEYDYSPYNCFAHAIEIEQGKFQIEHMKGLIPMVYVLEMVR